jgi:predicted Zn-dependent protease
MTKIQHAARFSAGFTALALLLLCARPALALTVPEEKELGGKFMEYVRKNLTVVDDPGVTGPVERVGRKILAQMPPQPFHYNFYVVRDKSYNAFAGPAGHVCVHTGLIEAMQGEDELAGILAHEIAHVSCRHIAEKIAREQKLQIASLAGIVAGALIGVGPVGSAVSVGSMAAGASASLVYSRADEMQADQVGLVYLDKAGYGAAGLVRILNEIRSKQSFGPNEVPTYLLTHPAVEDRLAYLDSQIATRPSLGRPKNLDPYPFEKVQARVMGLYPSGKTSEQRLRQRLEKAPTNPAALYGTGLLQAQAGDREGAAKTLEQAVQYRAFDPELLRELGRLQYELGHTPQARETLAAAVDLDPESADGYYLLGRAELEGGDLAKAEEHLRKCAKLAPDYGQNLYHLGQALGKRGKLAEAHYYLGRYSKLKGDTRNALFHLEKALLLAKGEGGLREDIEKELKGMPGHRDKWDPSENPDGQGPWL